MIRAQVAVKAIHLVSIMGNKGTFTKSYQQILTDTELIYHVFYFVFCLLGLFKPYAYSILVSVLLGPNFSVSFQTMLFLRDCDTNHKYIFIFVDTHHLLKISTPPPTPTFTHHHLHKPLSHTTTLTHPLPPPAAGRSVPGRNAVQRHPVCDPQRVVHRAHGSPRTHPHLPLFHHCVRLL